MRSRSDPINAYYDLLIAVVRQAVNDYLTDVIQEKELENFFHDFFSDDDKVELFMRQAKLRKELRKDRKEKLKCERARKQNQKSKPKQGK